MPFLGGDQRLDAPVGNARHNHAIAIDEGLLPKPRDRGDDVAVIVVVQLDEFLLQERGVFLFRTQLIL